MATKGHDWLTGMGPNPSQNINIYVTNRNSHQGKIDISQIPTTFVSTHVSIWNSEHSITRSVSTLPTSFG